MVGGSLWSNVMSFKLIRVQLILAARRLACGHGPNTYSQATYGRGRRPYKESSRWRAIHLTFGAMLPYETAMAKIPRIGDFPPLIGGNCRFTHRERSPFLSRPADDGVPILAIPPRSHEVK